MAIPRLINCLCSAYIAPDSSVVDKYGVNSYRKSSSMDPISVQFITQSERI